MATYTKFNAFVEAMAEGKHNLASDQLVIALCNAANAPTASNSVLSDLTQIAYTNLSSRNLTTVSSSQAAGTYSLVLSDLTLLASGPVATFRYVVVYNDTATNDDLIAFYDHGSDVTLANAETFFIDFGANLFTLT